MNKSQLETSVASWEQSVTSDRFSIKCDMVLFGGGALMTGLGIGAALCGAPEGLMALVPGGVMGGIGLNDLRHDIKMLAGSTSTLTARQHDLVLQSAQQD